MSIEGPHSYHHSDSLSSKDTNSPQELEILTKKGAEALNPTFEPHKDRVQIDQLMLSKPDAVRSLFLPSYLSLSGIKGLEGLKPVPNMGFTLSTAVSCMGKTLASVLSTILNISGDPKAKEKADQATQKFISQFKTEYFDSMSNIEKERFTETFLFKPLD